jgi:protein tyrosine phosphatase (PTP) superfamily phosphohydrolase (DUF442 family)
MVQALIPTPTRPKYAAASLRALAKGVALAGVVVFVAECLRIFVGSNFHMVAPGKCYRAAQPTPTFLADVQRKHGIRSIVNLRDENIGEPWYDAEVKATGDLHITLVNAGLWSNVPPKPNEMQQLVKAIKEAEEPILIHCANGNDRSGLAAGVYLLLRTDTPLGKAQSQLSLRYGHLSFTKAACLQGVLRSYESWLYQNGEEHTPERFYHWAMNVFEPAK